jgi:hypothetical protein
MRSKALKARAFRGPDRMLECVGRLRSMRSGGQAQGAFQRQEGKGVGDGERLHEGSKALKGEPQERIRHEIRPAGSERMKVSGG